jgi:nucleoside-diphosphate-sugar epimerase
MKEITLKIVVIGGTSLIGSKLVNNLREHGHEAVAASPKSDVQNVAAYEYFPRNVHLRRT